MGSLVASPARSRGQWLNALMTFLSGAATSAVLAVLMLGVLYARLFGATPCEGQVEGSGNPPRTATGEGELPAEDDEAVTPVQARVPDPRPLSEENSLATAERPTPPDQTFRCGGGPTPATPPPAHPTSQSHPARATSEPPSPSAILPRNLDSTLLAVANAGGDKDSCSGYSGWEVSAGLQLAASEAQVEGSGSLCGSPGGHCDGVYPIADAKQDPALASPLVGDLTAKTIPRPANAGGAAAAAAPATALRLTTADMGGDINQIISKSLPSIATGGLVVVGRSSAAQEGSSGSPALQFPLPDLGGQVGRSGCAGRMGAGMGGQQQELAGASERGGARGAGPITIELPATPSSPGTAGRTPEALSTDGRPEQPKATEEELLQGEQPAGGPQVEALTAARPVLKQRPPSSPAAATAALIAAPPGNKPLPAAARKGPTAPAEPVSHSGSFKGASGCLPHNPGQRRMVSPVSVPAAASRQGTGAIAIPRVAEKASPQSMAAGHRPSDQPYSYSPDQGSGAASPTTLASQSSPYSDSGLGGLPRYAAPTATSKARKAQVQPLAAQQAGVTRQFSQHLSRHSTQKPMGAVSIAGGSGASSRSTQDVAAKVR